MYKFYWISLLASVILLRAEDRVELFGSVADANGSVAHASGNPVVIYEDQLLSADELSYDRNTTIIEAKGSVNVFKARQYHSMSDYARINLNNDTRYLKPYYALDHDSGLWMSTDEATGCKNEIDLASGAISGCSSTDPLWKIRFSSANYDTDAMWVNLYNARLEINDVPVFYLPYFGYPTDKTRRSGLLIPYFGWSNTEGFFYQQPIYYAPKNWFDVELRPQVRTNRGEGIYGDFRFVDSSSSSGYIRMGLFEEQSDYALKHNLAHNQHHGYELHYQNSAFLREWFGLKLEGESGLYVDGKWMNDVDYLNLQHTNEIHNVITNQVISRVNAFYNTGQDYFGAYLKYYQYLDLASNAQTIQTLPSLQYHRYLQTFLNNHLLLNTDATVTNFYRQDGKAAVQGDINIPIMFQISLMDEYLDLSYTANAHARTIGFYGNESVLSTDTYKPGNYLQLDHTFKIGSNLVRNYEDITHVLNPNITYTSAGTRMYTGYYDTYHSACNGSTGSGACDFYTITEPSDSLGLGVNNYFFKEGKQLFADRLSQNYRHDQYGTYNGELQNELEWNVNKGLSYYNQTSYNPDRNRITKEQNTLRYNGETVTANVSHYYTDIISANQVIYSSYLTADASYRYDQNYRFSGLIAYDYENTLVKRGEVGVLYSQRCLDFGVKFVQNIRPIVTNISANDSVSDSYIFLTIILKPIGGSVFNYKMTNN
ncbi:MAG: LPS assembly protein LptD [Sulfuricurvum sp.]|nr:LPS assembly protein LptD [Sulfuricurvum sp.]